MKKTIFIFAAVSVLIASCAKTAEDINPAKENNEIITFEAECDQTKTNLAADDNGVYKKMVWSDGDKIGVFDASGVPQPFTTETGGASAIFKGSATAPSGDWHAFYPYNAKAKLDAGKLHSAIPEIQYAKMNGVSDNVTLLVAKCAANETSLKFQHACGLVKIELPVDCINVTLEILNPTDLWHQTLSGGVKIDVGAPNTDPQSDLICYPSVTLVGENGGNIPAGTYYLAVKPIIKFTGDVLLSIRNAENKIFVKKHTGLTVAAGQILPINFTPTWVEDDGINIFSEMGENSAYTQVSGDAAITTDASQPKIYGTNGTKIQYDRETAWSGKVGPKGSWITVADFIDKGYSLEYYVKLDESMLKLSRQLIFKNWFKTNTGNWESNYEQCNINRYNNGTYPITRGIEDTEWHRISFPLTSALMDQGDTQISQFIIDPDIRTAEAAKAAYGAIFYFDEVRLVRKTPTE